MSDLDYTKFKDALSRLQERYNDYLEAKNRPELKDSDRESILESCIQRFETCFDTSWKHLRKYMEEEQGLPDIPGSPKPVFRKAFAANVIGDAEVWIEFTDKRIDTSHDYDKEKAEATFAVIPDFISEAIELYQKMSGETWPR